MNLVLLTWIIADYGVWYRFKFTRLSPVEPNRAFSFLLYLQPDNTYNLNECNPELDKKQTNELLHVLNSDNDNGLTYFLVGMSKYTLLKLMLS